MAELSRNVVKRDGGLAEGRGSLVILNQYNKMLVVEMMLIYFKTKASEAPVRMRGTEVMQR